MGQFSWYTQDTQVPIYNDWDQYGDQQTIHMVDPRNGKDYVETEYDGYGRFGGVDYYVLLANINKDIIAVELYKNNMEKYHQLYDKPFTDLTKEESSLVRLDGIHIEDKPYTENYPILVEDYNKWKLYIGKRPQHHENQGWHYIEEDEDEEEI